ncbi:MAG: hypothetical protein HOV97_05685 [Nonomuraea sp.]|nr:hypothetical protein [Nonomuraea sp.]
MSRALLLELEEVLEESGWGRPAMFYVIEGTEDKPVFLPFAEIAGHPCDVLQGMWRSGARPSERAIGLALVVEGERHLRLEEFKEREPEGYQGIYETAAEKYAGDLDVIETAVETAWREMCSEVSPASMPESRRVHVRNSVAVLHNGWTLIVNRDQGGDPEALDPVSPTRLTQSRVPDFMWQFLMGKEPVD